MRFAEFFRPLFGNPPRGQANPPAEAAEDATLRDFLGKADFLAAIDDARVRRVADAVLGRLADESPARRLRVEPSGFAAQGYRLAALIVVAALLGAAAGWYTAVVFDRAGRNDLQAVLAAPIEHPFGL